MIETPSVEGVAKEPHPNVIDANHGLDVNGSFAKALGAGVEFFAPKPSTAEAMLGVLKQVLTPKR